MRTYKIHIYMCVYIDGPYANEEKKKKKKPAEHLCNACYCRGMCVCVCVCV
jgi:hypothetical protein